MRTTTHHDMRTGATYATERGTRVTDMRTGRPHAKAGQATARAIYGASLRLGRR